ncbi:MAG: electron transfer flavoprotein subunit alpha/FixB family protein [Clostridiales Family XIII bacterium]|jgi:electron transfer flavoprotein alpha subunit|nr:electron transfer flavoprotein subunit alpha/FixB family protein [Clostridiales Family XIII bacterium]
MTPKHENLWVFIEVLNGSPKSVSLELLGPGRLLADAACEKLVAVIVSDDVSAAAKEAAAYGADQVIAVEAPEYGDYSTEAYTHAICTLAEKYRPSTILIGATSTGRDMGPRVACRLRTGLTADCTALDRDTETGDVLWTRPAFGGNLMATICCPDHRPQIGTVRPGVFKKGDRHDGNTAEIIREDIRFPKEKIRARLIERIADLDNDTVDLETAEFIVSGGRGLGGPENFALVRDLAKALGGEVGSSRAAVDAGWISHAHQVGQTGKTVGPRVYIACGISGAIQHLAGMSGSDTIIAINKNPDAAIFEVADYGIIGDLCEVLPALTAEVRKLKA